MQESKPALDRPQLEHKIHAEQVASLYSQAPAAFVMQLALVSFIALSTADQLGKKAAFFWWATLIAFSCFDFFGYVAYKSKPEHFDQPVRWYRVFIASVAMISLVWGLGGLYLITRLDVAYQLLIVVMMAMTSGAALPALSLRRLSLAVFLMGNLLPIVGWLLCSDKAIHLQVGAMLLTYGVALWFGGWQLSKHIRIALTWRFENEELAESLRNSNSRLQSVNQELIQLSSTDPLTQVANRRYFDDRLDKEWRRIIRDNGEVAILMIDVDHFKLFNDNLGHQEGDKCLRSVALSIRDSLRRPADMVARYGGEEFIVLLPHTTREGAVRVAEMIRENVILLDIKHPASDTREVVTVSIGISYCHPTEKTLRRNLISKADEAMYESKELGRNRVTLKVLETDLAG